MGVSGLTMVFKIEMILGTTYPSQLDMTSKEELGYEFSEHPKYFQRR